ncbi:hypothetical protein ACHHYP_08441 [Achlya hypogyna]|uniref:Uncharacterized protein n=1 Tax=Achlya hypogyna TaxID=1202772 RepID=A0A1V9ZKJ6_ACHHY|nr:hypothetical protein ACHHYP_08441 [Achlya hypogyna]
MASFKQLFSAAPPRALDDLMTGPRIAFYGFLMFAPGTLTGLYLYSVKLEMESENEAARLVMLGKARAEIEAEEALEAKRKGELTALATKIDLLQARLHKMERTVLGEAAPPLESPSADTASTPTPTDTPVQAQAMVETTPTWSVAAVWVRLREMWDEEDELSWDDLWSLESWQASWKDFCTKIFDDGNSHITPVQVESLWATLAEVTSPTPIATIGTPDAVQAKIASILAGTTVAPEDELSTSETKGLLDASMQLLRDAWLAVWEGPPQPTDEELRRRREEAALEEKVLARFHKSSIEKRKLEQQSNFEANDLRTARATRD